MPETWKFPLRINHLRVSLWQVLNHLLLLARCTGARSEMLTAKLPGLRNIAVENRKGGWYGSKDGYVTSVCPNMAPQISTSKSLAFLDQTKSQNHSCKPRTLVMLRRNHPSFELRSYWPIPDMTGWRLSNRLGKQSSGNLKRRETGSILFQLEPDMCTKLTFHVTIHSIISTDVPKLLGGLTPWKLALLFCGWTPWRISSEHYPNLLFFWLCLLIQLIQFFPPKFKTHAQLFYPSQNWVPKIENLPIFPVIPANKSNCWSLKSLTVTHWNPHYRGFRISWSASRRSRKQRWATWQNRRWATWGRTRLIMIFPSLN